MRIPVPPPVLQRRPGTLNAEIVPPDLVLYLREDSWGMRKYVADAKAEMRLGVWEIGEVLLSILIVRVGRSDVTTFDCQIDLGSAPGVRTMQCLAVQNQIDLHLVTDQVLRSWRLLNPCRLEAARLVDAVRNRAWDPAQHEAALARVNQLYPTAHSLWWHCAPSLGAAR